MDNLYFRGSFPYCIRITKNSIDLLNRHYKSIGLYLNHSKIKASEIKAIADKRPDSIRLESGLITIFMYDDNTNPVASIGGFDSKLWDSYNKRLGKLLLLMQGKKHLDNAFVLPQDIELMRMVSKKKIDEIFEKLCNELR